jgi:flagellin
MAAVVNTNVMSLNAQRQLNKSQATSNQAMERLSSGLRINSAKDDAAGLAISTGMQSQIKGMNQAVRNANDGVSMAQTAEGSMDEMTNILQRMRELSVQSANATNSDDNRKSIQTEVDQLYSELGRISESTQFNGINLLDGSAENVTMQIGANNNQTMDINIKDVSAGALGIDGGVTKGDLNGGRVTGTVLAADTVQINGVDIGAVSDANKLGAAGIAEAINVKSGETNVTANAYNSVEGVSDVSASGAEITGVTTGMEITVGLGDTVTLGSTNSMENLRDTINKEVTGVNATISSEGQLQLTNDTGESIKIGGTLGDIEKSGLQAGTFEGYVALSSTSGDPIKVSGATTTFGLMESNGAGSLIGAGVTTDSNIDADDAITINGEALVVNGPAIVPATDPATYTPATLDERVAGINTLTEKTGVTAEIVEVTAASADFEAATFSTTSFAINDADIVDIAAGGAAATLTFDGEAIDISTATDNASMVALFEANANLAADYTFTSTATSFDITERVATTGNIGVITVAPADVDAGVIDAAADAGTAKLSGATPTGSTQVTGILQVGDAAEEGIVLTATEGTEIVVKSGADTTGGQTTALAKLGMIETGGTKSDDLGIDVTTAKHAGRSIDMIDEALGKISSARADLGAVQNRLGSTISNLENVSQNLSASNSRIQDADFAAETSKMSKSQILQQAGTSMLSQANASAQSVLSLLG